MINTFYNLFLHTNSSLMYKLNTVKIFKQFVRQMFLKSCVMSDKSKSKKNRHILPVCDF